MDNYKRERYEFIEQMLEKVNDVPINEIISRYIPLTQRGRHYFGLCPFHKDTKFGSFIVTPDKGIWKCFTCGDDYAGNGIKFVSLYKNLTYLEAAFDTALSCGVITKEEFDKYIKKKWDNSYIEQLQKRYSEKAKDEVKPVRAPADMIHHVYQTMKDVCPLSEAHMEALKKERRISEKRIQKDYFTFPINWRQKDNIVAEIQKRHPEITDDILKTVPGFYYDETRKKIMFYGFKGMCILIRNAYGLIRAVQIRRDTVKDGEARYIWMSSMSAFYKEGYSGGAGCGSPKDVVWGIKPKKSLCITEGRFKAETLAENGNTTISIQGVSSWRGITNDIEAVKSRMYKLANIQINDLYVFLDSDILGNHPLFLQSTNMCNEIAAKFPNLQIKYAFWKKEHGKGIDDYLHNNGSGKEIKYIHYKEAAKTAEKEFKNMLARFKASRLQELTTADAEKFRESLQNSLECLFLK